MILGKTYLNGTENKIYLGNILIYPTSSLIQDFVDRVLLDGGIVDTVAYLNDEESTATLIMNPSAYKDGVLYAFKPEDGSGDFTFTRGSAGTIDNKLGFLEEVVGLDTPRITHEGGIPALLMEDESTNLFLQSNDFNDGSWRHNSTLSVTNGFASPDGTLNAYGLIKVGGGSRMGQIVSLTSGLTYTFSFYMKNNGGTASLTADFGVQSVGQPYTITNDWERYDFTFTATSTVASEIRMFSAVSDIDLLVFGAQLEQGTLSSYIPTTTAIRTRLEDVATRDLTGLGITSITETINGVVQTPITVIPTIYSIPKGRIQLIEMI